MLRCVGYGFAASGPYQLENRSRSVTWQAHFADGVVLRTHCGARYSW